MKANFTCSTNGKGLWSHEKKKVRVKEIKLSYLDDDNGYGELVALFDKRHWNPDRDGLIYTDPQWMKEFRKNLETLGFSAKAARDVDYTEQGMQGSDYVSLGVGQKFLKEWDERIS